MSRFVKRVSKLLLSVAYWCVTRPLTWFATGSMSVITYHQVRPEDAARFARQVNLIKRAARAVFPDDVTDLDSGERRVAVTFDDFFESALHIALPLLRAHAIPSVWFVPAGSLGGLPGWIRSPSHENSLAKIGEEKTLRELDPNLVRVGSHTVSHPRVAALTVQESVTEMRVSKMQLSQLSGTAVDLLAWPYGEYRQRDVELARACGYKLAFTNVPVRLWGLEKGVLRGRVPVDTSDWPLEFWLKLRGGYNWLAVGHWLRHRFQAQPEPGTETALA